MYTKVKTQIFDDKINYFSICQQLYREIKKRDKLLEKYAFITSHELRAPIARIMGLINLYNTKRQNENLCSALAERLSQCARELDEVTHVLNELTAKQHLKID